MAQIIHIGYPKTGSTWLQKSIFTNTNFYYTLIKSPILKNIYNPEITVNKLTDIFKEISVKKNIIISDEDLVTNKPEHVTPEKKAERIKLLFPNAVIVIFIRNQLDIIPSAYDQYIKGGGVLTFSNYITELINSGKINHWQYHHIIQKYYSLFGSKNVKVFLSEQIKSNNNFYLEFLDKLGLTLTKNTHIMKTYNRGLTEVIRNLWRLLNYFTCHQIYSSFPPKNNYIHVPGLFSINRVLFPFLNCISYPIIAKNREKLLKEGLKHKIKDLFKESNKILIKDLHIHSIVMYNYPLK